jgi:hypothetical protein
MGKFSEEKFSEGEKIEKQNSERELWQKFQREVCLECCEDCFIPLFFYIFNIDVIVESRGSCEATIRTKRG